jgi:hypothetical protein
MLIHLQMEIDSTVIFQKNYEALNDPALRFVINEGGSRSSRPTHFVRC